MLHVNVLSAEDLIEMNDREHDIVEAVVKTEIRDFTALSLSLHAAFMYQKLRGAAKCVQN